MGKNDIPSFIIHLNLLFLPINHMCCRNRFIACTCCIIITLFFMFIISIILFWIIISPSNVKFHVTDASLTEFNLTNQQKHDPFPISITHRQTLSTFSFPCVIVQIHRPYGDEILGSVSPRSKFRIHSLEQIAGTNLQTLLRHSSLQSKYSLSLHITSKFV